MYVFNSVKGVIRLQIQFNKQCMKCELRDECDYTECLQHLTYNKSFKRSSIKMKSIKKHKFNEE